MRQQKRTFSSTGAQVCFTFSTPLHPSWNPVLQLVEREIHPLHCRWQYQS